MPSNNCHELCVIHHPSSIQGGILRGAISLQPLLVCLALSLEVLKLGQHVITLIALENNKEKICRCFFFSIEKRGMQVNSVVLFLRHLFVTKYVHVNYYEFMMYKLQPYRQLASWLSMIDTFLVQRSYSVLNSSLKRLIFKVNNTQNLLLCILTKLSNSKQILQEDNHFVLTF